MRSATRSDTHPAALRRARSRRARRAGSLLAAGLLLALTGCGSDGDSGTPPDAAGASEGGTGGAEPGGGLSTDGLLVCSLVDFQPLLDTVQGEFTVEPEDVEPGSGSDPGGPQCAAQLGPHGGGSDFSGQVHLAVVPYDSEEAASGSFDDRVAEISASPEAAVEELDGTWAQGTQVSAGSGDGQAISYALLRDGALLYKAQITWQASSVAAEDIVFTAADIDARIRELAGELHTAVAAEEGS
ncbi:hypothetical protein [Streptomyces sp. B6B3]|uniref:hypothetical protein n=1 Tax=Streptomyces sp. B6B3 TaxID=3153570 RepID=UPI00325EEB50